MAARTTPIAQTLIGAALRGELDEQQARQLAELGSEVVALALISASRRIAALLSKSSGGNPSPSTPSGMIPIYAKVNTFKLGAPSRRKKPGAKVGHVGARRERPTRIDRRVTHRLKCCPHCRGKLQRCHRSRTRIIEDLPEHIQPVVTEHTIHRDYCPRCKKHVEPVVPEAMPQAAIGHRLVGLTGWFHYGLGLTIDQIVELLGCHLQTRLTPGGLVDAWQRLGEVLEPWYEQIGEQAKTSSHLHADETGWRVNGQTHWLWCFANHQVCYYMIDRCRGSPALQKFFTEAFEGVLITDFWSAYGSVCAEDRQYCLVHLLRELEEVDERNAAATWRSFARRLRALLRAGIRLRKRSDFQPGKWQEQVDRLNRRLAKLASEDYGDADARRLANRLRKYAEYLFTFLDYADVPFDNNFAERQIRPAVIIRKNSLSNRSDRGAMTQSILMSVFRTLKLRGLDPIQTVADALRICVATDKLTPLPHADIARG
jgi:transposase